MRDQDAAEAFDLAAEHLRDVVLRVDALGVLQYVSPSVRAYGHEPADLIGGTVEAIVHPDDLDQVWANTRAVLAGGPVAAWHDRQNRYRTAAGGWVWMEGNPRAVRDPDGRVVGMVNVLRDVTERRALSDLFESSFQHAAIGMALVGLDGGFLRVNPAFCEITGYPQSQMERLDFQSITHPGDLDKDLSLLSQLSAGAIDSYRIDKRYVRADGAFIWAHLTVSMVRGPDGAPRYYVAQAQDQSQQRNAEAALSASEARNRVIAQNTSDIISMTDEGGIITYISPSVRRVGYAPETLVGQSFGERMHPVDREEVRRVFDALREGGETARVRWRGMHGETGDWIWLESIPSLVRDPVTRAPTGFLDVIRDVTAQVEQEAALADTRARAESAAAAKSQFLANMSHEIRTPLTAVLGFTGLLQARPDLPGEASEFVSRISGAGAALLAIVNDILDYSKLEAGKFEIRPQPSQVAEICRESLMLFSGQAAAKGLALDFEAGPDLDDAVMLDGDRLRQMLINLIGNAIKFTETGRVRLSAGLADGVCRIAVADTGPGLDEEAQGSLFQRFSQVDASTTRRHGGTGLGLAICRGIVEAMRGEIGVMSTPGHGATFYLTIPTPSVAPRVAAEMSEACSIAGMRIFVVDDNATNRELARRLLEAAGAEVSQAEDGLSALAQLALMPVDAVLMDLRMPGLDGRLTLSRLRQSQGPNKAAPVLAFTADADVGAGWDIGQFDGLVRKPMSPGDMYEAITDAVAWARARCEPSHAAA